jgi:3-hydroxyacyl-[acyl-carrier-protein] dehydratase
MNSWFTLDQVTVVEPRKGARGFLNVPNTLSLFADHFPRFPVLPGVLVLGSLADLSMQLLKEQTGYAWRLGGARQVRFRHFIQPGDRMELSVALKRLSAESALLSGTVLVDGRKMVTADEIQLMPNEEEARS